MSRAAFLLLPSNIPSCEWTPCCLSVRPLVAVWVAAVPSAAVATYIQVFVDMGFISVAVYLGEGLLGHLVALLNLLRNCEPVSRWSWLGVSGT